MFKYVFFMISTIISLFSITAFSSSQDELSTKEQDSTGIGLETNTLTLDPSDEDDGDEPSLDDPSVGDSTTFDAGPPPVTEESLEEDDSDQPV